MIVFWILAVGLISSSVFVISAKKPVYSVVGLLANFACLSVMYLTLSAEFLAVTQILVYSGAILILFLFVIALLSSGVRPFDMGPDRLPRVLAPLAVGAIVVLGGLLFVIGQLPGTPRIMVPVTSLPGPVGTAGVFGSVADFGRVLFTTYLLPFEATAFILMIAVIGVVALAGDIDPPRPDSASKRSERLKREERAAMLRGGR